MEVFYEYIVNTFVTWLLKMGIPLPVIIWSDYHETRVNYYLSTYMREKGIYLIGKCVLK